jgi:hypothetical protein
MRVGLSRENLHLNNTTEGWLKSSGVVIHLHGQWNLSIKRLFSVSLKKGSSLIIERIEYSLEGLDFNMRQ